MNEEIKPVEILEEIQHIRIGVSNIHEKLNTQSNPYESNELSELFTALSKAQLDMEVAKTDSTNPFFKSKYADLASIVKASRSHLAKNGLSIIQRVIPNESGTLLLYTRLCHASGQWMESRMAILPPKQDIQTLGSYITYLRRYNYASMAGVVASDEDDDGETAMEAPRKQGIASKGEENITKAQLQVISNELEGYEDVLESLLTGFNITKLSELPAKRYSKCLERIREIKRAKDS